MLRYNSNNTKYDFSLTKSEKEESEDHQSQGRMAGGT
jgi:hypothetical protein